MMSCREQPPSAPRVTLHHSDTQSHVTQWRHAEQREQEPRAWHTPASVARCSQCGTLLTTHPVTTVWYHRVYIQCTCSGQLLARLITGQNIAPRRRVFVNRPLALQRGRDIPATNAIVLANILVTFLQSLFCDAGAQYVRARLAPPWFVVNLETNYSAVEL